MTLFIAQGYCPSYQYIKLKVPLKNEGFSTEIFYKNRVKVSYSKKIIEEVIGFPIQESFFVFTGESIDFFIGLDGMCQKIEIEFTKSELAKLKRKYPFIDKK